MLAIRMSHVNVIPLDWVYFRVCSKQKKTQVERKPKSENDTTKHTNTRRTHKKSKIVEENKMHTTHEFKRCQRTHRSVQVIMKCHTEKWTKSLKHSLQYTRHTYTRLSFFGEGFFYLLVYNKIILCWRENHKLANTWKIDKRTHFYHSIAYGYSFRRINTIRIWIAVNRSKFGFIRGTIIAINASQKHLHNLAHTDAHTHTIGHIRLNLSFNSLLKHFHTATTSVYKVDSTFAVRPPEYNRVVFRPFQSVFHQQAHKPVK